MDELRKLIAEMLDEIDTNLRAYDDRDQGDAQHVLELRIEQYKALSEMIERHLRTLEFKAGKPIKPQTHHGEAVLIGVFGGGT